ncbi:GNAT family N-acetyltransferase [Candidatus Micrarchaeota archaeon]|nr:GNAT family N-acetyltransferase [Candidatus Micrarchaeota archaeon]
MIIRKADKSDINSMIKLYDIVAQVHTPFHPIYKEVKNPGKIAIPKNYIGNPNGVAFVAEINENGKKVVVGFAGVMFKYLPDTFETRYTLHLTDLAVFPEYRRKGVATALLQEIIEYARKHKIKYVTLDVALGNHPALMLYKSLGFEQLSMNMIIKASD